MQSETLRMRVYFALYVINFNIFQVENNIVNVQEYYYMQLFALLWELVKFSETGHSALKPVTSSGGSFKTLRIVYFWVVGWKSSSGELCQVSSPCSQVDDSYHIVLWPVPWNPLWVCRAGSAVVVWCVAFLRDRGLTAPGIDESIKVSACHCVFVCRLPGLVVPVGRGIELTIDRLALRNIGVRNGSFLPQKTSMTMIAGAEWQLSKRGNRECPRLWRPGCKAQVCQRLFSQSYL